MSLTPLILWCCCCYFPTPPQYGSWCTKHQVPLCIPSNLYIVWKRECCNPSTWVLPRACSCAASVFIPCLAGTVCLQADDGPGAQPKIDGLGWVLDQNYLWAALLKLLQLNKGMSGAPLSLPRGIEDGSKGFLPALSWSDFILVL